LDFSIKLPPHHLETVIDSISDAFASRGTRLLRFFSWSYGFALPGIEATSTPVAVAQGLDMIRKLGTLAEFSVALAAAPARFNDVFRLVFSF
jgi:hypothetical protein